MRRQINQTGQWGWRNLSALLGTSHQDADPDCWRPQYRTRDSTDLLMPHPRAQAVAGPGNGVTHSVPIAFFCFCAGQSDLESQGSVVLPSKINQSSVLGYLSICFGSSI